MSVKNDRPPEFGLINLTSLYLKEKKEVGFCEQSKKEFS